MADSRWGPCILVYLAPDCATLVNILFTMEIYPFVVKFLPVLDLSFLTMVLVTSE